MTTIRVSKLEAACRQLRTAITLWFNEADPVSVHTLAFAAYEVFHSVSERRNPYRRDLIFDTLLIKDEFRRDWLRLVKKEANFFKHADRNPEDTIEFNPKFTEWFILYASLARGLCGADQSEEESAFLWWFQINRPELLTEHGKQSVSDRIPVNTLAQIRRLTRRQFREGFSKAGIASKRPNFELC
jgi:hypothetical protein